MEVAPDFYRSRHDKLVGREWLLNELDETMLFPSMVCSYWQEWGMENQPL